MTDKKDSAKRRLKDITFEHSGAHVALVHKENKAVPPTYTPLC